MLIVAFSFLGWQALLSLVLFAITVGALWRLARLWGKGVPAPMSEVSLWAASLLLILFWRPWSAWLPW